MANEEKAKEIAIENLNGVRPYDFETEREKKWYEIGLIDGKEAADVKYAKFASYEDKTLITTEWLVKNEFEKREYDYLYCDDVVEISAQCTDTETGTWHVYVNWLDSYNPQSLDIYTLGQLRMFLSICGLDEIVEQQIKF